MSIETILDSTDQSYNYGPEISKEDCKTMRERLDLKITTVCDGLIQTHGEQLVDTFFNGKTMHMSSVAIIGTYLRRKNEIEHLYICSSIQALQEKLREISTMVGDIRAAFVLPNGVESQKKISTSIYHLGDSEHKVAVCLEKIGADIKIVILDSLGTFADEIGKIPEGYEELSEITSYKHENLLYGAGALFHFIYRSFTQGKKPRIFYSSVERQKTGFGCETLALRDAVSFLRGPRFFENIKFRKITVIAEQSLIGIYEIAHLPPVFMKGVQHDDILSEYLDASEGEEFVHLKQCVEKHTVRVVDPTTQSVIKTQNHYLNHRDLKYNFIVLNMLQKQTMEQVQAYIAESLLLAKRVL